MKITKKFVLKASFLVSLLVAIVVGYNFLLSRGNKIERDMRRLSDMKMIQAAFERNFADHSTYKNIAEGCSEIGSLLSQCSLETYVPQIQTLRDPSEFTYVVKVVPTDTEYAMSFTLEKGNNVLGPGEHLLTHNGFQ